ncbi:hypothetical protein AK812_SmicGene18854 [Symbiodinium microadriaticum]|uniref:Isopenicillin N synthase-like Fe(2+) 2OG dioxygenase domain-containing protein n=1 Tax=Symbiodinium microadriaticum TaxID=2951 RepID=A0A1Q9DU21_SYMMI|nr:hypothetical protein AK812_SmicGene18854 [Symbiodinium microadriaticum]
MAAHGAARPRHSVDSCERSAFSWEKLRVNEEERMEMCKVLATRGWCVLELPDSLKRLCAEMQDLAQEFFRRPRNERCALGRLRLYRDKVVGYRELAGGSARFLEVHARAAGRGGLPAPKVPAALGRRAAELHQALQALARSLIAWMAEFLEIPPEALLQSLDEASLSNLEDGDCSASVLRLCSYGFQAEAEEVEAKSEGSEAVAAELESVVFDEPVGSLPGLQFRDLESPGLPWWDVESGLSQGHLVAFVGDFLEVLTRGAYVACRHRVCCEADSGKQRFSMPFLVCYFVRCCQ